MQNEVLFKDEALERGKSVITTDGAPAWRDWSSSSFTYLTGYREGDDKTRVQLLKAALKGCLFLFILLVRLI